MRPVYLPFSAPITLPMSFGLSAPVSAIASAMAVRISASSSYFFPDERSSSRRYDPTRLLTLRRPRRRASKGLPEGARDLEDPSRLLRSTSGSFWITSDGWLYLSSAQANRRPEHNGGIDRQEPPYAIFRMRIDAGPA
jgi:hypothetical protein